MATDSITLRLAAACGLLSQYAARTTPFVQQQQPAGTNNNAQQQLTIFYGGMVVVLDGCTPEKAAELISLAAAAAGQQAAPTPTPTPVDTPISRNASLRHFLAKRKDRAAAAATVPDYDDRCKELEPEPESAAKKGKLLEVSREEAASWLALGSLAWDDPSTRAQLRL